MLTPTICPQCHQKMDHGRIYDPVVVCASCGWTSPEKQRRFDWFIRRRYIETILFLSALTVFSFVHFVKWNSYFFEIIPLKVKQITNSAQNFELERIAQICLHQELPLCAEEAYTQALVRDQENAQLMLKLGKLRFQLEDYLGAANVYTQYFQTGATNLEAAFLFARSLAAVGNIEQAQQYYEYVLDAKPGTLQITVIQHYVNDLIKAGQLNQARQVIEGARKLGVNAKFLMQKELDQIKQALANS